MTTPVKPEPIGRVLTGDEWEAAQYAPHRLTSDPKKPLPPGRVLTGDEWEQAQRAGSLRKLTFPAMPKFAADATRRLNPNAGKPDNTLGEDVVSIANALDQTARTIPMPGASGALQLGAILGRQVVAPVVEHPIMTAAMMNPVGGVVGGMMAAHTVAKYGWQVAHESQMTPEERAEALKDPDRVSGEAAAVQGIMLGLGAIAGVHAVRSARTAGDFGAGMMEAGAKGLEGFKDPFGGDALKTVELKEAVAASGRRYFETEKGAEVLGTTAGAHGLPETASPFPPASPLDVAWKQGHSMASAQPEVAPPVTPESAPSGSVAPPAGAVGLALIEGTGKVRTRGLSRNIEAKALANNLSEAFGDLPEYRQLDLDNQAQFALDFIARDPDAARRVAMGQENAPQGLSPASVLVELENRATTNGDPSLVHDLATGRLAEQGTTMGQFIRILGERNRESPVAAVQELANRRKGGAKAGRFIQRAVKDIEKHTGINADQIAELINTLRC